MNNNIALLDNNKHKNLKLKTTTKFEHMYHRNVVPLVASEFMHAAINFPIFFIKEANTAEFKAVGLLGFDQDENLYFTPEKLNTNYFPQNVQRYPFVSAAEGPESENFAIAVDMSSDLVSETDGQPLFTEAGEPTEDLHRVSNFLSELMTKEMATKHFIEFLVDHDLLHEASLSLALGDEGKTNLNGVYKVDEERLNAIKPEVLQALHKKHYLPAIYAHLTSIGQLQRMVALKRLKSQA